MRVNIFYKGEFVATGETTYTPWTFWTFITPSPEMDRERLIQRLKDIQADFGPYFDVSYGDSIGFPPAYTVKNSEGLI